MKQQSLMLWIPLFFIFILGLVSFHNLLNNKNINIKKYNEENVLAIYLEDEQISYIPEKDSGYTLDLSKSNCTNGVELDFDYNTWIIKTNYSNYESTDNTRVKCNLFFKERTFAEAIIDCGELSKDAGTCIKENVSLTDEIVDDETSDNNLRYIGSNPNNYVWFNDELWRIIGAMNNIDDGTGTKESRLKIVRAESIGNYSWDTSTSTVNNGYGVNEWSQADLMKLLNPGYESKTIGGSLYFNSKAGSCWTDINNESSNCDFTDNGLKSGNNFISPTVWNTGSNGENYSYDNILTSTYYDLERSQNSSKICSSGDYCTDTISRNTSWKGYVGLIYPSDFGYATSGGNTTDRATCLATELYSWSNYEDCYNNNWLYDSTTWRWTLSSFASPTRAYYAIRVGYDADGIVRNYIAGRGRAVYPVTYLVQNVKIISGNGTKELPFQLSKIS